MSKDEMREYIRNSLIEKVADFYDWSDWDGIYQDICESEEEIDEFMEIAGSVIASAILLLKNNKGDL